MIIKKVLNENLKYILLVILLSVVFSTLFTDYSDQQFSYLSQAFLKGRLDISEYPIALNDSSFFNGKYYWPLGPFPAIIILPFTYIFGFFNLFFFQKYLQIPLVIAIFYLCYQISRKLNYSSSDSIYLVIAFNFASSFLAVIQNTWSWEYAIVVSVLLIFLGIYEYLNKKRYFFIGLIYACLLLTRVTAALGIVFFIFEILLSKNKFDVKLRDALKLLTPVAAAVLIFSLYNFFRFGSFFEQGYSYQLAQGGVLKAREYGLFSPIHIPGNLYYFLIAGPVPVLKDGLSRVLKFPFIKFDPWGMGIIFTSPYFIYLCFLKYKDKISKLLWLTSGIIALSVFLNYGIGINQFGYRYSLDFLPYLFLLLIMNYNSSHIMNAVASSAYKKDRTKLSVVFKTVIVISSLFNLYLLATQIS